MYVMENLKKDRTRLTGQRGDGKLFLCMHIWVVGRNLGGAAHSRQDKEVKKGLQKGPEWK